MRFEKELTLIISQRVANFVTSGLPMTRVVPPPPAPSSVSPAGLPSLLLYSILPPHAPAAGREACCASRHRSPNYVRQPLPGQGIQARPARRHGRAPSAETSLRYGRLLAHSTKGREAGMGLYADAQPTVSAAWPAPCHKGTMVRARLPRRRMRAMGPSRAVGCSPRVAVLHSPSLSARALSVRGRAACTRCRFREM